MVVFGIRVLLSDSVRPFGQQKIADTMMNTGLGCTFYSSRERQVSGAAHQ
jgi:hypothetical protein